MTVDFNLMVGGEAGQGVQSVGQILDKTLASGGLNIFADQDYESRVRGGHNFFRIRTSDSDIYALSEKLDILVALNRETVDLHRRELKSSGVIIVDAAEAKIQAGGRKYLDVPLLKLAEDTVKNKLMANTVAVGAVLGLVGYDFNLVTEQLRKEFGRHGKDVVDANLAAARAGYDYAAQNGPRRFRGSLRSRRKSQHRMLLHGNEAIALGAMAAGCKFFSGYPMTPASSIMEYFTTKGLDYGVVAVHVEDEISAMNMAVGAGFAGVRSMVATSGGGFALMVEGLSLAGITETPVVIALAQRPGPATGLPTRTEQGELWFPLHAGHGEFPRAIFAPGTVEEAFHLTIKAFNTAEKYQTPVFILTDHHLATSYNTVDRFDLSQVKIDRGALLSDDEVAKLKDYNRHALTRSGVSPRAYPGQGKALVMTDSDEHDEAGHMIEDGETRNQQHLKRLRKEAGLRSQIGRPKWSRDNGSVCTLIGWGSTYGAISEAASLLKQDGAPVNVLHISEVWPFPAAAVSQALSEGGKKVIVEGNATGQMGRLIRRETGIEMDHSILRFDGRPLSPEGIVARVKKEVL